MNHPKVDPSSITAKRGSGYPQRFHDVNGHIPARAWQAIGAGLTAFGANRVTLPPGSASSLRHWHTKEDELVVVVAGHCVMLTDEGETPMTVGDVAVFPMNCGNGHCFVNRTQSEVVLIVVGNNDDGDECFYPDVGMRARSQHDGGGYVDATTGLAYED